MSEVIKNRYEFAVLFDVENGNPNGDPDAGNMPRIDPETGYGIVTDVCLKRKIRNYIDIVKEGESGYDIYIKSDAVLNQKDRSACEAYDVDSNPNLLKKAKKDNPEIDVLIRNFMCKNFFDIRAFGAVMTTFVKANFNCGQVRGPVQLGFARSADPVTTQEISVIRCAITADKDSDKTNTMGNKFIIPYGLYKAEGYISANLARKVTGFTEEDLELLWEAIINMFEHDHSAARGKMSVRKLIIFKHDSELGNAPAYKLFDTISIKRKEGVKIARCYGDYDVTVDTASLPDGVSCEIR